MGFTTIFITNIYIYIYRSVLGCHRLYIYSELSVFWYQRVYIYTEVFQGTREYTYIQKCFKEPESIHIYRSYLKLAGSIHIYRSYLKLAESIHIYRSYRSYRKLSA